MIANERQLQVTRKKLRELERLGASVISDTEDPHGFRDLQIAGVESIIGDLRDEIGEYERLRSGTTTTIEASSQQVQRDEAARDMSSPNNEWAESRPRMVVRLAGCPTPKPDTRRR